MKSLTELQNESIKRAKRAAKIAGIDWRKLKAERDAAEMRRRYGDE